MKPKLRILWLSLVLMLILAVVFSTAILTGLGSYLVRSEPPQKGDIAIVLGGDASGNRILKAAELVRQGYAPKALVSGPSGFYGLHECDFAIPFAVSAGYPESYFVHFHHEAKSTKEEAVAAVDEFRRLGVRQVLVVTTDYHTRRAAKTLRATAPDLNFRLVSAPDFYFSVGGWWRTREGRKVFLIEWMKTVAEWVGL